MKKMMLAGLVTLMGTAAWADASNLITEVRNDEQETLIADSYGRTLYVFDLDQGAAAPKCTGDCAEIWPPYLLSADEIANLKAPLGFITRTNKKAQLTYEGRPVYTYMLDRVKGDDQGDGLGGVWHYIEVK